MQNGVVIIALGYNLYGSCAFNLAMSLKAYDSNIKIAVLHDNNSLSHLSDKEKSIFDNLIFIDESVYTFNDGSKQYQYIKLCVDKFTPFENTTVIDADTIWFPDKKFSWFLGEMIHRDFWIGYNDEYDIKRKTTKSIGYTFWALNGIEDVVKYHKLTNNVPQTVSGLFFFKKGEFSNELFNRARKIYNNPSPNVPWAAGKPDEYCFNVALSEMGYTQTPEHVVYFDKTCGKQSYESIYQNYWCLANGGAKCEEFVVNLYNKLVRKYAVRLGFNNLHFHTNKSEVIPERKAF